MPLPPLLAVEADMSASDLQATLSGFGSRLPPRAMVGLKPEQLAALAADARKNFESLIPAKVQGG